MPTAALALPIPAQSRLPVWNLTRVKPISSSLTAFVLTVRVQFAANPKNGASFVPASWLGRGARSGSEV
jgi:hypothetical protein